MSGWSDSELATIGTAAEIDIAPDRADHTPGPAVPIWVVRVGDDLYVRSYRGPSGSWYRRARRNGSGRISVGGVHHAVRFTMADPGVRTQVDEAYRAKYGRYDSLVRHMISTPSPIPPSSYKPPSVRRNEEVGAEVAMTSSSSLSLPTTPARSAIRLAELTTLAATRYQE